MNAATLAGLTGAVLAGLGLYGLIVQPDPLRRILAFNVLGSGVFLVFGIIARRGAAAGALADPVPQALVITGIVVAFAATALYAYVIGDELRNSAGWLLFTLLMALLLVNLYNTGRKAYAERTHH